MRENVRKIRAIMAHRKAFFRVERALTGKVSYLSRLHDLDKVVMLLLGWSPRRVSKIHRAFALHHESPIWGLVDVKRAIIDWECARFTKPDKPLDARGTLEVHYPHLRGRVLPVLEGLGL